MVRSARPAVAATNSVVSPSIASRADLGDPVGDAAVHLDGGLAVDMARARQVGPAGLGGVLAGRRGLLPGPDAQLPEPGAAREPRGQIVPVGHELLGRRPPLAAPDRFLVAVLELGDELLGSGGHFVGLRHDDSGLARARQVIEERRAPIEAVPALRLAAPCLPV